MIEAQDIKRPTWDYRLLLSGKHRVLRFNDDRHTFHYSAHDNFIFALAEFAVNHLPIPYQSCVVLDENNFVVLGWSDSFIPTELETDEYRYAWFGCEEAFNMLGIVHNEIDAALWATLADPRGERG